MKDKIESFLKYVEKDRNKEYAITYDKPSKLKCILCFSLSVAIFMASLLAKFSLLLIIIWIIELACVFYYGYNLFNKDGIALRKIVPVKYLQDREEKEEEEEENENRN